MTWYTIKVQNCYKSLLNLCYNEVVHDQGFCTAGSLTFSNREKAKISDGTMHEAINV